MTFTLHFDTKGNKADRCASSILRKWAEDISALSNSKEGSNVELMYAADIHKQVYMAGLFLHLLSPTSTRQLSNLLIEGQINKKNLINSLTIGDVATEDELTELTIRESAPVDHNGELGDVLAEVVKLKEMLSGAPISISDSTPEVAIDTQRDVKETLDILKSMSTNQVSPVTDTSSIEKQITKQNEMLSEILSSIKAGGQTQTNKSGHHSEPSITRAEDSGEPVVVTQGNLDQETQDRINKAKRVKGKGCF